MAATCALIAGPIATLAQGESPETAPAEEQAAMPEEPAAMQEKTEAGVELEKLLPRIHRLNRGQVALGWLALSRAESPDVVTYAKDSISAYTDAEISAMDLARKENVRFVPSGFPSAAPDVAAGPPAEKGMEGRPPMQMVESLAKLSGPEFDRSYLETVTQVQEDALQKLRTDEQQAQDKDVKNLLGSLASTVEDHLKQAQELTRKMGSPTQPTQGAGQ